MPIEVKINFNPSGIAAKIQSSASKALPGLAAEIRNDCNFYAPDRTNTLIKQSNIIADTDDDCTLKWGVPYASYVFKGKSRKGNPLKYSKNKNPNAQKEWCKKAKEMHLADWRKYLEKEVKENYKND